jgi:uncharacterized protein
MRIPGFANLPVSEEKYGYITLKGGAKLDLFNPDPNVMTIEVIAHGLSNLCRFCGQINTFYSVAQHSVLVASNVPWKDAFVGLMHDATEAFCADLPKPIKQIMPEYEELEGRMWKALCDRYPLPAELPSSVHKMDIILAITEARDLLPGNDLNRLNPDVTPLTETIKPWPPHKAKKEFLITYELMREWV